jgi:hypothetical protein
MLEVVEPGDGPVVEQPARPVHTKPAGEQLIPGAVVGKLRFRKKF